TYYMGKMTEDDDQKAWADSVNIVFPVFDGGGTNVNVSGVAMAAASPNKEAALKLIEFLVGDEAQKIYAETNHEFPVSDHVERSDIVKSWGEFTADSLSLSEISALRPEALTLIEEVDFDG